MTSSGATYSIPGVTLRRTGPHTARVEAIAAGHWPWVLTVGREYRMEGLPGGVCVCNVAVDATEGMMELVYEVGMVREAI